MNSKNHFTKIYEKKSTTELQKIVNSPSYQEDAKQAAIWELERREIDPSKLNHEDTTEIVNKARLTFNTGKKETRLHLLLAISVIGLILRFFHRGSNYDLKHESIFDIIGLVVFVILMIYTIKKSLKKLSTINESFEISEDSLIIMTDKTILEFNRENKPASISRSLNELKIIEENGNEVKVNLVNYSLSYSQSKLLTRKVRELQNNWTTPE